MRARVNSKWRLAALAVTVAVAVVACGGGTEELGNQPVNGKPGGPLPTASNGKPKNANDLGANAALSGNVDVNDLIRRIDALNQETDLCALLTGAAMSDITGADINLTSLVSNPAGFSQLFASLDKLFGHMVQIAPAEAKPQLTTMQGVWNGLSSLDLKSAGAQQQASTLVASPEVQTANDALGKWVVANCKG